jgi:tRNA-uridine 2-sulfurtransferase
VNQRAKILVAMSGGVDSSVAAGLLVRAGWDVTGAYMKNWINEANVFGNCPWQQDIEDARAVADHLGIRFHVVNLMKEYRERIVEYLLRGYASGITPNPDVLCNREMKFGVFLEWALENGFDAVATGHYARVQRAPDGTFDLLEGVDKNKDQSYFLAMLRQDQIAHALFPLGDLQKPEVRRLAAAMGLPNAAKKDSQGICFIGEVKMSDFLKTYLPDKPGNVVDLGGRVIGRHRGLHFHTLGQKRGVGVASPVRDQAYVVVAKRMATNELVMALETPDTPGLYARGCRVGELSFPNQELYPPCRLLARPRYRAPASPVVVESCQEGWLVEFEQPQRALAPGQFCAFYEGEKLVAAGVFQEIFHPDAVTDARRVDS